MTDLGPLELVVRTAAMLDELEIPYALGGSLAATFFGEPRSTMDIDVAIEVDSDAGEDPLRRAAVELWTSSHECATASGRLRFRSTRS